MVVASVHEMRTGAKVGEIIVFGRDLGQYTGREALAISRLLVVRLGEMQRSGEKDGTK